MRLRLIAGLLVTLLVSGNAFLSVFAQEAHPATLISDNGVSVTIYNQGTALVQDRRTFGFGDGLNLVNFTDVAAGIDRTSVSFNSISDPTGTYVLEQNYVYDLVDKTALLQRYIDEAVEVTALDGTQFSGTLLSGSTGDIILQTASGGVVTLSIAQIRDIRFPGLPEGLITRPTLRWLLSSSHSGEQQVELTYLTSGMNWSADYIVLLAENNTSLDLNGWVTLNNYSGTAYRNALVKLIAGDVSRLPGGVDGEFSRGMVNSATGQADTGGTTQRDFSEYKLYEINRRVDIGNNETKQVEFVTRGDIPATTFFVYDGSPGYYNYGSPNQEQYYGKTAVTTVQNYLEFKTTTPEDDQGVDLPAGRMRVYQQDIDGSALLIGESSIDHTPGGEKIRLYLGNAFDLVGERTQTDFVLTRRTITETYEIRLRNRKETDAVEIRVPERLFRWTNWEITESSMPFEQMDSNTIEFRSVVEPGGEVVITYTVQYTLP